MQRALDTGAVIRVELTRALIDVVELGAGHLGLADVDLAVYKTRGGDASQIKDDLEQVVAVVRLLHRVADVERENIEKRVEIVGYF